MRAPQDGIEDDPRDMSIREAVPAHISFIWSPPPANDPSQPSWSLVALVEDLGILAADLHLRDRVRPHDPPDGGGDIGTDADNEIE